MQHSGLEVKHLHIVLQKIWGTSLKELKNTYDRSHNEDVRKELAGGKITESDRVLMGVW